MLKCVSLLSLRVRRTTIVRSLESKVCKHLPLQFFVFSSSLRAAGFLLECFVSGRFLSSRSSSYVSHAEGYHTSHHHHYHHHHHQQQQQQRRRHQQQNLYEHHERRYRQIECFDYRRPTTTTATTTTTNDNERQRTTTTSNNVESESLKSLQRRSFVAASVRRGGVTFVVAALTHSLTVTHSLTHSLTRSDISSQTATHSLTAHHSL